MPRYADEQKKKVVTGGKLGSPEPIAALNRVRIVENKLPLPQREPLVNVLTYCPGIIPSPKLCPYLRVTVADMLNRAVHALAPDHRLHVHTCLRTLAMQKRGWDGYFAKQKAAHPEWPLSSLRRAVNQYYAPYDQPAPPGHCTGGAVDVAIHDMEGNPLDVISPTTGWEAAYTWSEKISDEARRNRMMMVHAMLNAGFSNCRDEYWHYSYGESAWAVRVGERECPYGWAHPPVTMDAEFEGAAGGIETVEFYFDTDTGAAITAHCSAVAHSELKLRLNWAHDVPTTIEVFASAGNSLPILFHIGAEGEASKPLQPAYLSTEKAVLHVTADCDRLIIASKPFEASVPTT